MRLTGWRVLGGGKFSRGERDREREREKLCVCVCVWCVCVCMWCVVCVCVSIVPIPSTTDRPPLSGWEKTSFLFIHIVLGSNTVPVLWVIFRLFIGQVPDNNSKIN